MKFRVLLVSGIFFIIFNLLTYNCAFGQINDAGLWTSIALEAKLIKKLSVNVSQEYRFNENVTELETWVNETGLEYKLNKIFRASVNYRYTLKKKTNNLYSPRQRIFIDIKAEKKFKPVIFQFRTRFQEEFADIDRAPDGGFAGFYSRNRFRLKYDLDKKWEPNISLELFSPLRHNQPFLFDDIRVSAGIDFALSKHHKLDIYYMIQRELNVKNPVTDFIGGIGYKYNL